MTHVTCRLTAKIWDQLCNPTLGNRVWATFLWPVVKRSELFCSHYSATLQLKNDIYEVVCIRANVIESECCTGQWMPGYVGDSGCTYSAVIYTDMLVSVQHDACWCLCLQ